MGKVKLTREQAEAIEKLRHEHKWSDYLITRHHLSRDDSWEGEGRKCLNDLNGDTLIKALYNGYEVEKSQDDLAIEIFKSYLGNPHRLYLTRGFKECALALGRSDLSNSLTLMELHFVRGDNQ